MEQSVIYTVYSNTDPSQDFDKSLWIIISSNKSVYLVLV